MSKKYTAKSVSGTTVEKSTKKAAIAAGEKFGEDFTVLSPSGQEVYTTVVAEEDFADEMEAILGSTEVAEQEDEFVAEMEERLAAEEAAEDEVEEDDEPEDGDEGTTVVDAGDIVEGWEGVTVVSGRRGHKPMEVTRIRRGRKHLTLFGEVTMKDGSVEERDIVWVPYFNGKVEVLVDDISAALVEA